MKKYLWGIFLALALLLPGMAAQAQETEQENVQLADQAELLSEEEKEKVTGKVEELEQLTGWDLMAVTTDDAEGMDGRTYAEHWFDTYTIKEDGVICAIDMDNREITVCGFGEGRFYITDTRTDRILDAGYEEITDGNYGAALLAMLGEVKNACEKEEPSQNYLQDEDTGEITNYDGSVENNSSEPEGSDLQDSYPSSTNGGSTYPSSSGRSNSDFSGSYHTNIQDYREITPTEAMTAFGIALGAGGIFVGGIIGKYRLKFGGYHYPIKENGRINLTNKEDRLVNEFVTTREIPRPEPSPQRKSSGSASARRPASSSRPKPSSSKPRSSGSRSTVHRGSGGRSSSGGSRKF